MNSILKNWIFVNLPIWAEYFWLICFGVMTFTADYIESEHFVTKIIFLFWTILIYNVSINKKFNENFYHK